MVTKTSSLFLAGIIFVSLIQCGNLPSEQSNTSVQLTDTGKYYTYPWLNRYEPGQKIINRIALPDGYKRAALSKNSFAHWLVQLPLSTNNEVNLYNGNLKYNQNAQAAVLDIDVGDQDLQQCADACMRLRAEYLYSIKAYNKISFNFTNGFKAEYKRWAEGERVSINGNITTWAKKTQPDYSYATFREYMNLVFMYAGTLSLSKELTSVRIDSLRPGDLFIKGGSPGHAVMIMDVATNTKGEKIFLLAQSYMPAQEIHILKNPEDEELSPWYKIPSGNTLYTPEWDFTIDQVKRWK